MPKILTQKHTILLREGDYQRISEVMAAKDMKAATVIRMIVSRFVDNMKIESTAEDFAEIEGIDKAVEL